MFCCAASPCPVQPRWQWWSWDVVCAPALATWTLDLAVMGKEEFTPCFAGDFLWLLKAKVTLPLS